jgi:hypothetical protein
LLASAEKERIGSDSERTDFPIATGSVATENTIGMVVVAALPRVPTRRQARRSPPPERQPARRRQEAIFAIRRFAIEASNYQHRRLRPREERPGDRRAAEKRDELTPLHAKHGDFLPCHLASSVGDD